MARVKAEVRQVGKPGMGFQAYWAEPEGTTRRGPGLVLIHTILGITEHERTIARTLAEMGFTVVAPDLYSHERDQIAVEDAKDVHRILRTAEFDGSFVHGFEKALVDLPRPDQERLRKAARVAVYAPDPITVGDLRWCVSELAGSPTVDPDHLAVVGLSMGGGYAWTLATLDSRIKACVVIYGRPLLPIDNFTRLKGPVLGIYAGEDHRITDAVPGIEEAMALYGKAFTTAIYPGLQHGFMDAMAKVAYHPKAARDAWKQIFSFLQETIGPLPVDAKSSLASPPAMDYVGPEPVEEEEPEGVAAPPSEPASLETPQEVTGEAEVVTDASGSPSVVEPSQAMVEAAVPESEVAPSEAPSEPDGPPALEPEPEPDSVAPLAEETPEQAVESVPAPPPEVPEDETTEEETSEPVVEESSAPGSEPEPPLPVAPAPIEAALPPRPVPPPVSPPMTVDEVSSADVDALLRSAEMPGEPPKAAKPSKGRAPPSTKAIPPSRPAPARPKERTEDRKAKPEEKKARPTPPPAKPKAAPPPSKAKPSPPPPAKAKVTPPSKDKDDRKPSKKPTPSKSATRKGK